LAGASGSGSVILDSAATNYRDGEAVGYRTAASHAAFTVIPNPGSWRQQRGTVDALS
jgi:hypothetical protein